MIDPESMQVFATVVRTGSFSEAGRQLNLAPSSVSRHVTLLETELGVQLLLRTTRSMMLTSAGELFQQHASRILNDLQQLSSLIQDSDQRPTGTLRISAPVVFGRQYLAPAVLEYMRLWPDVEIELDFTDRLVDLVEQGVDIGIRIGQLPDSTLVARRLGPLQRLVCASPMYLEEHGVPDTPQALTQHQCITFHVNDVSPLWRASGQLWRFAGAGGVEEIPVAGRLRVNSADVLMQAALAGKGLVLIVDWVVRDHVESGRLVPVLTDYVAAPTTGDTGLFAVYPSGRHAPAKVRTFVDHIQCQFEKLASA